MQTKNNYEKGVSDFSFKGEINKGQNLHSGTLSTFEPLKRVEHEKTGFIAKTQKEFVNYSSLILNDNIVYKTLRQNLYNRRNSRNYSHVKKDLINILTNND